MSSAEQEPLPARAPRPKVAVLAAVAALVLALDATSKALVVAHLTPGEPVHAIGNLLMWDLLRNPGAAWNVGTGYTIVFTVLAFGVIAYVVRTARRLRSIGHAIAFGLLLGGAAGNLADRLFRAPGVFRGEVVDWIEVTRYYPVFNLADSSICIAAVIFVILALRGIRTDGTRVGGPPAPGSPTRDTAEDAAPDQAEDATPDQGGTGPAQSSPEGTTPSPAPREQR